MFSEDCRINCLQLKITVITFEKTLRQKLLNLKYCVVGTRIIYDRKFLLDRRNSPIAQTPPAHLPVIPGVTSQNMVRENQKNEANNHVNNRDDKPTNGMSHNVDQNNLTL